MNLPVLNTDYLIVGQGLAGTLLSHALTDHGKSVMVLDAANPNSASRVAAGLFNPVTGRRLVKTWMADTLFPCASETYRTLERELNSNFFHEINVLRPLADQAELSDLQEKMKEGSLAPFLADYHKDLEIEGICPMPFGVAEISYAGYLDTLTFLDAYRNKLKNSNSLVEEEMDYLNLHINEDSISYKNINAKKIIFCEGWRVKDNPWFSYLPFSFAKGEVIEIQSDELKLQHATNRGAYIVPLGNNTFRAGATYEWEKLNEDITSEGREELIEKLKKSICVPYNITSQRAGVRPATHDRRPYMGLHPKNNTIGIFNGLGTKGVSLAPFFASHFAEHLVNGKELIKDVDIKRVKVKYTGQ